MGLNIVKMKFKENQIKSKLIADASDRFYINHFRVSLINLGVAYG